MSIDGRFDLDPDDVAEGVVFGTAAEAEAEAPAPCEEAPAENTAFAEAGEAETAVEETACEAPTEETPAEAPAEAAPMPPLDEYKQILDEHFQNLRALIKYTKAKDETIQKLSGELQKYREDYCTKTFKSIATLLISYREDCRRSLSDLDAFAITMDKAKKYIGFLCDDFEELLSNAGCEEDDGAWSFNGKPLTVADEELHFPALFAPTAAAETADDAIGGRDIRAYLQSTEEAVKRILADNELLDKCLKDYCTLSTSIESGVVMLSVYPPLRRMISLFENLKRRVAAADEIADEEEMKEFYRECLIFMSAKTEDVLLAGGIHVETPVDDAVDVKKNRILKVIPTDDEALDRRIAKQHTECYMMNETILAPAKVDVYKYQAPEA